LVNAWVDRGIAFVVTLDTKRAGSTRPAKTGSKGFIPKASLKLNDGR